MDPPEEKIVKEGPPGIRLLRVSKGSDTSIRVYKASVLIITFVAYACYHASRKPISIVKGVLKDGWAPFNGPKGTARLGEIDVAFLLVYSLGMYCAGHLGDRLDLRHFLTVGMIGSGSFVGLFGMGYWLNIHNFLFYLAMQMVSGLFQATGWPSVVAVVGNWFGKGRRGLIMGIWNAHTSIGNICGSLIAAGVLHYGWGWSFAIPGILLALAGIMVFLFLVVNPQDVGLPSTVKDVIEMNAKTMDAEDQRELIIGVESGLSKESSAPLPSSGSPSANGELAGGNRKGKLGREEDPAEGEEESLLQSSGLAQIHSNCTTAVGFIEAWMIPGVAHYALCLFFSKLVAYTFLYWLPLYIRQTAIGGKDLSHKTAGNLSTLFDVGGVLGGILAGHISDRLDAQAITAAIFLYCAIPALILYRLYGSTSMYVNIALMMTSGLFVNGPYSLITTTVSADLGTHSSLKGNARALATVTAIIDGTGSVGAALGPLLTGYILVGGWNHVFTMLILATLFAALLLMHLVLAEIRDKIHKAKALSVEKLTEEDTAEL